MELAMCVDAIETMARLWDIANDEDRKGMAQNLFDEVVVNLDTRRIESFKLKPWVDRFLVLRMELYRDEYPELAEEIEDELGSESSIPQAKGQGNDMPHRGLWVPKRSTLDFSGTSRFTYSRKTQFIALAA